MSLFKGSYLRILKPLTTNGVNVKMNPDGTIKMKESHLSIRAKKMLEKKNLKLPAHLKMKIEVVDQEPLPPPERTIADPQPIAQLNTVMAEAVPKKRGRKKKTDN